MTPSRFLHWPLTLATTLAGGVLIGATMFGHPSGRDEMARNISRIQEVLSYIRHDYVDTVNTDALGRHAIDGMLERLDPHSAYVPAEELKMANAQLEEDFDGIGVEFVLHRDTIEIVSALSGGPSAKAGMRAGDRIVRVNAENVAGIKLGNVGVFNRLRGPRGSEVTLEVVRPGVPQPITLKIRRGRIPTRSVDAALMVDAGTGYIKISRFSAGTDREFRAALKDLRRQNLKRLVLDLRDNPGGYLDKAIQVADEFLPAGRMIVYTEGKAGKYNAKYKATKHGQYEGEALVVLLNEGSASASEILAGALQDNDRAMVVGRRSFGKGLVQMPIPLSDGGELRLTISRYYTPSGRCIQKPYSADDFAAYEDDLDERYANGELFHEDSIRQADTVRHYTLAGRVVYGGGGIKPDFFVPFDSVKNNPLLSDLYARYTLALAGAAYGEANAKALRKMGLPAFKQKFAITDAMLANVLARAKAEGIKVSPYHLHAADGTIRNAYKAFIARAAFGEKGFYAVSLQDDDDYRRAVALLTSKKVASR